MGINIDDFIYKFRSCGLKKDKMYHLYCDTCGADRGYNAKCLSKGDCQSCSSKKKMIKLSSEERCNLAKHAVSFVKNRSFTKERKEKISKANTGKVRSLEVRKRNSAFKQGVPLDQWKEFSYNTDDPKRSKYKSERFCKKVYELANYTCDTCKSRGGKLHAHHLDNWGQFKEKRYELSNIVCLCLGCHRAFHKQFGTRNNIKEQYIAFKESYVVK